MELSAIQTTLVTLVTTVASLAVGFGAFSSTTEQVVVSAAGTLIGLGFSLFTELERKTVATVATAKGVSIATARHL